MEDPAAPSGARNKVPLGDRFTGVRTLASMRRQFRLCHFIANPAVIGCNTELSVLPGIPETVRHRQYPARYSIATLPARNVL
jgi:hypothetical protein